MCKAPVAGREQDWSTEHEGGQWRVRLGRQLGLLGLGAALEPLKGFSESQGHTCGIRLLSAEWMERAETNMEGSEGGDFRPPSEKRW